MPGFGKNWGEEEARRGGSGQNEAVRADEGVVVVVGRREEKGGGEGEPEVGVRVEGKGLIILEKDVALAQEKKPWMVVSGGGEEVGEGGGGDDGAPELADGGGADDGGDGKVGEDERC